MSTPSVFLSYCREDDIWRSRVAEQFARHGIDVWDDTRIQWGEAWRQKIAGAIADASGAVLLLSEDFLKSDFVKSTELPQLKERQQHGGFPMFPIEVRPCDWSAIPWLCDLQIPRVPPGDSFQTGAVLTAIVRDIAEILRRGSPAPHSERQASVSPPERVSLGRLPCTSPELFGRETEAAKLDEAWNSSGTTIVSVVGFGGVGKTALVNRWLTRMSRDNFRGAELVYGWSFFNQGIRDSEQSSADVFVASALEWFGDSDPAKGTPWDKGARLAELVRRRRTLLVLDGLETLQGPPEESGGRLSDAGLQSFLSELVWYNPGLCVITTRLAVRDLEGAASAASIDLGNLRLEDGAAHLARLGVKGTRPELEGASKRFDGHALSLTLLGKYLVAACGGDVRQCDKISSRLSDAFDRIMEAYEGWLKGKPDLSILQLIGLFDRPATTAATTALIAEPPIEALTSGLQRLSEEEWRLAVSRLRADRLLDPEDPEHPDCLDCHPLVRRHFAEKIKRNAPAAWKEANGRLYEYYRSLPTKDLPETLDEMTPLFAAIRHGCEAGRHQEAWDDVYLRRTRRYGEFYSTQKLGAFGADLAALACFFDPPWRQPAAGLDEPDKGVALNEAGEALRALGRLKEAVVALEGAERHNVSLGLWKIAAVNAGNLSQLFLSIGDLERALSCGCKSVELAERSSDIFQRMVRRCDLANALHHSGRIQEAKALFEDAEQIQKGVALALETQDLPPVPLSVRWEWQSRLLHAVRGFQYCDLLLGQGRSREVLERAAKALEIDQRTGRLLHVGLDHLVAGRAHLMQTMEQRTDDYAEAAYHLEQALAYLRQCGRRDYLPRGLTARVELHRTRGVFKDAQLDLDEAISIANWDGMALHQADCHLEYARLYLAMDDKAKARQSFSAATRIVETTGYHRRDGELELIGASL